MRTHRFLYILLALLFLFGVSVRPAFSAFSTSTALVPISIAVQFGSISGAVPSLGLIDQSGTDNNPSAYMAFSTSTTPHYSYSVFQLPTAINPLTISNALLQINFRSSDSAEIWTWSIYNWVTKVWVPIGDSIGTPVNKWNSLVFPISSMVNYISPMREIRIQLKSNNLNGSAKLDYEALHLTYLPVTPTATHPVATEISTKPGYIYPNTYTPTHLPTRTSTPTATSTPTSFPDPTGTLSDGGLPLNLNHETGDLSQYTAYVTDGGDLAVSQQAALAGSAYGLRVLIDDGHGVYAYKILETASTTGVVRARFYIDPNGLAIGDPPQISFLFLINSSLVNVFASMKLMGNGNSYYLRGVMVDDNEVHRETAMWPITDGPHYVEIRVKRASSATAVDATYETWIDGVSKATMTGVDSYEKFYDFKAISVGLNGNISGTVSGTYYLDEIVVNDDGSAIGPVKNIGLPASLKELLHLLMY